MVVSCRFGIGEEAIAGDDNGARSMSLKCCGEKQDNEGHGDCASGDKFRPDAWHRTAGLAGDWAEEERSEEHTSELQSHS